MAEKPKGVYVPVDVTITDDEDIMEIGTYGLGYYISCLAYSKRRKTDGFIYRSVARSLLVNPTLDEEAELDGLLTAMVNLGILEPAERNARAGYQIRNWGAWNPTDEDRAGWRDRKQRSRDGHDGVTGESRDGHGNVTPMSRLEEKGREEKGREETSAPGWEDFWTAYPRKKSKRAAEKAYKSAVRRSSPAAILAGLEAAKATTFADRPADKIPYASTWLNADGWLDEPDTQAYTPAEGTDVEAALYGGEA